MRFLQCPSRKTLYILMSNVAVALVVIDAFLTLKSLFPAVSFLTTSRTFHVLLANAVIANGLLSVSIVSRVFFGHLQPAEKTEVLQSVAMRFMPSIFGLNSLSHLLSRSTVFAYVVTTTWRAFHTAAVVRLASIERAPLGGERLSQIYRLACFLTVAVVIDTILIVSLGQSIRESGVSIALLFMEGFAQMLLHALATMTKLYLLVRDEATAGGNNNNDDAAGEERDDAGPAAVVSDGEARFYVESFVTVATSLVSVAFFMAMMRLGFPLYLLADVAISLHRTRDAIRLLFAYHRLGTHIDRSFPDATEADLGSDPRCAICYDDMLVGTGCKRLGCGHSYHKACLRRWFQKSTSCPYCRKEVVAGAGTRAPPPAAPHPAPQAPPVVVADELPPPGGAPVVGGNNAEGDDHVAPPQEADADMERLIRQAYEEYIRMQPQEQQHQQQRRDAPPATGGDEVAVLRAQLEAYRAYRDEVEDAARRLDVRLAAATFSR